MCTRSRQRHSTRAIGPSSEIKGRFRPGPMHPRWHSNEWILAKLATLPLGKLRATGVVEIRDRSRRYAEMQCDDCGKVKMILVDNLTSGKTKNCRCQKKYGDIRARTLGARYDSMVQRCRRWTHVSSVNYIGRGIEVRFQSREHFIRWALAKFPKTGFKGLDFDRIDNDGHYEPDNLRLVSRAENLLNTRRQKRHQH